MSDYDALDGSIPDTEESLNLIRDHVDQARSMPMSASVMVNKDELLGLIEDALAMLPEEIRQARWLLKEREEFLAKARKEAEEIIEAGRQQAERMVERTEVVRSARRTAERVVRDARPVVEEVGVVQDVRRHVPGRTVERTNGKSRPRRRLRSVHTVARIAAAKDVQGKLGNRRLDS